MAKQYPDEFGKTHWNRVFYGGAYIEFPEILKWMEHHENGSVTVEGTSGKLYEISTTDGFVGRVMCEGVDLTATNQVGYFIQP